MNLADSNAKPELSTLANNVSIQFAQSSLRQLQIKHIMTSTFMKPKLTQNESLPPSLFQIAARMDEVTPASAVQARPSSLNTPFVDLMLNPKKLEAALMNAKKANDAFEAARRKSDRSPMKLPGRNTPVKRDRSRKFDTGQRPELVKIKFSLEAPLAQSVKLAADFTGWEKLALDMIKSQDGRWVAMVSLSPGNYCYRFIVDGRWQDDPHASAYRPNPFGTVNAVVNV